MIDKRWMNPTSRLMVVAYFRVADVDQEPAIGAVNGDHPFGQHGPTTKKTFKTNKQMAWSDFFKMAKNI